MIIRPRLRTILLVINLIILLLPLGGISVLRIYENELVRQTETELIGQASLITAAFREAYRMQLAGKATLKETPETGAEDEAEESVSEQPQPGLEPLHPSLELPDAIILPPAPLPLPTKDSPDPLALAAAAKVAPLVSETKRRLLSGCRIVDRRGIIVATSAADAGTTIAAWDEVARALAGEANSQLRVRNSKSPRPALESVSRGARLRVFVAHPVMIDKKIVGAVLVSRTPLDVTKSVYRIRWHLAKATLAILAVAFSTSLLLAYYLNRPLKGLIRQAERARSGLGFESEERAPGIMEFDLLSDAMTRMAATIESRSAYIRTFATAVSHEFKTPLTSLKGAMELLREHYDSMNREERERFLSIIGHETDRLEMLVTRLLEMARAEAYTPEGARSAVPELIAQLATQYRSKGLSVTIGQMDTALEASISSEVLSTIISNLLGNSLMHNRDAVEVKLEARTVQQEGRRMVEIIVSDNGRGISEANSDRIFRPFFTTAREQSGSGLGLSIIGSLLEAHSGSIELLPSKKGAVFRMLIPQ